MKAVLVIDNQKDNLTSIKAIIKTYIPNCKVLTALSGKEGIKLAKEEQPDTILLNIIMPEMDGYEVCKILKEDQTTQHISIILISAAT
jgi:CheY-like chemotaxis protein